MRDDSSGEKSEEAEKDGKKNQGQKRGRGEEPDASHRPLGLERDEDDDDEEAGGPSKRPAANVKKGKGTPKSASKPKAKSKGRPKSKAKDGFMLRDS